MQLRSFSGASALLIVLSIGVTAGLGQGWTGGNNIDVMGWGWTGATNHYGSGGPGLYADALRCHPVGLANFDPVEGLDYGICDQLTTYGPEGATPSQPTHSSTSSLPSVAWIKPDDLPRLLFKCAFSFRDVTFVGSASAFAVPASGQGVSNHECERSFDIGESFDFVEEKIAVADLPFPASNDVVNAAPSKVVAKILQGNSAIRSDESVWQTYWIKNDLSCCQAKLVGNLTDDSQEDYYLEIGTNATIYRVADPSGDDLLTVGGQLVPIVDGIPYVAETVEITRSPAPSIGPLAKEWVIESRDDAPAIVDFKLVDSAWRGKIYHVAGA